MIDSIENWNQLTRRGLLGLTAGAFGTIPLARLLADETATETGDSAIREGRVKRVIFFFMNGGPSQIDTFDPKPALEQYDGMSYSGALKVASGKRVAGTLWRSAFKYQRHGESGLEISEIYPELAQHADDLCVIRSLQTESALHAPALLQINTGRHRLGAASLGAWVDYGLGTLRDSLPSFVVMLDHRGGPINSHGNWSAGPLPTTSASVVTSMENPFLHLSRQQRISDEDDLRMQKLLSDANLHHLQKGGGDPELSKRIRTYELAWKMQQSASEAVALSQETQSTLKRYGLEEPGTRNFGTRCLLGRRLLERGVRFVQIYSGGGAQKDTWDSHVGNVERHRKFAGETDRPLAAFLEDLKQQGLWEETLVLWGGEFGRTPTREANSNGRDHNPHGFTMWLSGGAVRGGTTIGATDEIGFEAVENVYSIADLHSTILHLLGLDHESLNFYESGIEHRLTGPQPCNVIKEALKKTG